MEGAGEVWARTQPALQLTPGSSLPQASWAPPKPSPGLLDWFI